MIDDLVLAYPGFAARYSLACARGETTALIGPSGGGKTTLISAIAGFEKPRGGSIRLDGADIAGAPPWERPVSILFQDHNLFPHLSAFENAALGLRSDLRLSPGQRRDVEAALESVGLAVHSAKPPGRLSGGQRQRAAIARVLLMRRPVLLLDEPFGALDPGLRLEMLALIASLTRQHRLITLLAIHTPADLAGLADRAAFIGDGEVRWTGDCAAALAPGAHPALDRYFGRR